MSETQSLRPDKSFQDLILALQHFWARYGCTILQPYDMEVSSGIYHPAIMLRSLGPKPWNAAFVQPIRRGDNLNLMQHHHQFLVALKPAPFDIQDLYLQSLYATGLSNAKHNISSKQLGWKDLMFNAWGLGSEISYNNVKISRCIKLRYQGWTDYNIDTIVFTYDLEQLAKYCQGIDLVHDLNFNGGDDDKRVLYGDVFSQAEEEYSRCYNDTANASMLFQHFSDAELECKTLLDAGAPALGSNERHKIVLPAYDQCIKASHVFNLLDARGAISVTERQSYILRVRDLAKACCAAWLRTEAGGHSGKTESEAS